MRVLRTAARLGPRRGGAADAWSIPQSEGVIPDTRKPPLPFGIRRRLQRGFYQGLL
jgi:hypothetical protein